MHKNTWVWVAMVAVAATAGFFVGRGAQPEPAPLVIVDPFDVPPAAPPATNMQPMADAIDRATDQQRRADQAAAREARRDRYEY